MYIDKNRLRRTLAAVAVTTSAGLALAAAGVVQAEINATPDTGAIHVAAGSNPEAPPGRGPDRISAPDSHVVVAGDSYWAIAESVLGDDATPAEVLAKTDELMTLNSARLGAGDPAMIHPGDVVYLEEAVSAPEVVVREDARVLVAAAEELASRPVAGVVREDARVLVAAAEELASRPVAGVVREDARVLVAAAEELASRSVAGVVVREDARVLVAAAEELASRPVAGVVVREDARVLVAAAEELASRPVAGVVVREDARVLVAAAAEHRTSVRD